MPDPKRKSPREAGARDNDLRRRYEELSALYAITSSLNRTLDLKAVLKEALEKAVAVTDLKSAGVCLFDPEYRQILATEHSTEGVSPEFIQACTERFERGEESIPLHVIQQEKPFVVDTLSNESPLRMLTSDESVGGMVSLPLAIKGKVIGVLCVGHSEGRAYHEGEKAFLEAVANQIAIAIENARLYEHAGRQAMIEERERLAREIHDGLAQTLAFINMQTQLIEEIVQTNAIGGEALHEMSNIRQGMNAAYQDLRVLLSGMKTPMDEDLYRTVDDYLKKFGMLNRLKIDLIIDDRPILAPMIEAHVLRIIQEALANVRKHARATSATVRIGRSGDGLRIVVEDDGQGFDAGTIPSDGREHFGLTIMKERVGELKGSFSIRSRQGEGTRVTVELPLETERRGAWTG
jgi:two-component system, NarL family, nitrate/nitrite sensor histidine kinase NarX